MLIKAGTVVDYYDDANERHDALVTRDVEEGQPANLLYVPEVNAQDYLGNLRMEVQQAPCCVNPDNMLGWHPRGTTPKPLPKEKKAKAVAKKKAATSAPAPKKKAAKKKAKK